MFDFPSALQKKDLSPKISSAQISDLPCELHDLIFFHVPDLRQVRRMGEVCKYWNALSKQVEINRMKNASQLDVEAISFLAFSLIMKRTKPKDDDRITRLCKQAALVAGTRFDILPPSTQMIVTIGRLYNENPRTPLRSFKNIEINKNIIKAANANNAYAKFILGLVSHIEEIGIEDLAALKDSKMRRVFKAGKVFLKKKTAMLKGSLHFRRKKPSNVEKENPSSKRNFLREAFDQDVYDAGYFISDSFMNCLNEAAEKGSVLASLALRSDYDREKAYNYLVAAANKEHPPAQHQLGEKLYKQYERSSKVFDEEEAKEKQKEIAFWIGQAALQNRPSAQIMLGNLIARDFEGARSYVDQMQENNLDTVHVEHGILFSSVKERILDIEPYFYFYLTSDSQESAYYYLSVIYFNGTYVEKDMAKAKEYASKCTLITQSRLMKYFEDEAFRG